MTWLMRASAAVLVLATAPPSAAGPAAVHLAPHRAVYSFALDQQRTGARLSELSGRYVYELSGSRCTGYTMRIRFVTRKISVTGETTLSDLRMETWEDSAGKRLRFDTKFYADQKLAQQGAGEAVRNSVDDNLKVVLSKPERKQLSLSRGVLFPVQHSLQLLAAARQGKTVYTSDLYDVAEKDTKVYRTTAVLGDKTQDQDRPALRTVENGSVLNGLVAWPVAISYYDPAEMSGDTVPKYEASFLFFENGISRRIVFDYGLYAIRGTLTKLTMLEDRPCKN